MTDLKRLIDWCDSFRACPGECDRANELATLLRSAARADAERFSSAINIAAVEAEADRQSKRLPNFFRECFRAEFPGDVDALAFASHLLSEHDADLASLAEKQRAIDEAMALAPHGGLMTSILRPHATPAATVKTRTVTVIDPTDDAKQRVTYTDRPQGPPRRWTSTPPADRSGKWWNAWGNMDGSRGMWLVPVSIDWRDAVGQKGTAYDLWLPWQEGDTRDNIPPLPNPAGNAATPQVSPVGNDTRELIARLAECVGRLAQLTFNPSMTADTHAIIAAARKETKQ